MFYIKVGYQFGYQINRNGYQFGGQNRYHYQ